MSKNRKRIELRVPTLPESVSDATILSWHKQPGDPVRRDENLVDLETDKVVLEVPATLDGVLVEVLSADGAVVNADDILGIIEEGTATTITPKETTTGDDKSETDQVLTPAVRRLVKELNLEPGQITGTGKDGRLLKSDVMDYLDQHRPDTDPEAMITPVDAQSIPTGARPEERVPMSRLRARIAERLVGAQQTAAILTTFNEVDLKAVMDMRARYKDRFEKEHGTRLGFMSFFVKATIEALKRFPTVNASVDGTDIIYHGYHDIGIAVGSPRGLVVPVLRDADGLSFAEIEAAIRTFGKKAQDGTLSYDELNGGTFTISNGGVYGSMLSTPILNPPQSGILGMHNIVERPVVVDGEIVIRPIMYLALSYDHRIVDGREAVQSLVTIKESLEDPSRLLLNL